MLIDGTSRAAIEASLISLCVPGETVLVVNFGRFGLLLTEILERIGARVVTVEAPWGEVVPLDAIADAIARAKFPAGVDGMRCDLLSVGLSLIHLGDGNKSKVISALKTNDPIETLRTMSYPPPGRGRDVHSGMLKRPILKQLRYDLKNHMPI